VKVTTLIVGLLVFIGLLMVLYYLVSRGTRMLFGPRRRLEAELGLEVLEQRLSRGQISNEEFEQAKRALGLSASR
jgi:uncharacterized membrane protein